MGFPALFWFGVLFCGFFKLLHLLP